MEPLTSEKIDAMIMASRKKEAAKHDAGCASLTHPDGECRCERDGVYMWCVDCGHRVSYRDSRGLSGCPSCGSTSIPCSAIDDVDLKVNWHELRILIIWAENWAAHCDGRDPPEGSPRRWMMPTLKAIAKRLQTQYPSRITLTLAGEFAELKQEIPSAEIIGNIQPDDGMAPPKAN